MQQPHTQDNPAPPLPDAPASSRRARRLLIAIVLAAVGGTTFFISGRGGHKEASATANLTLSNGAIEIAAAAPEWQYLELATALPAAPLPPLPTPARVVVDDERAAPMYAPLPGRVEQVPVQLGQQVKPGDRLVFVKLPGTAGGSRLVRRAVRLGRAREGQSEIVAGLEEGDTYVARGALLILNAVDLAR